MAGQDATTAAVGECPVCLENTPVLTVCDNKHTLCQCCRATLERLLAEMEAMEKVEEDKVGGSGPSDKAAAGPNVRLRCSRRLAEDKVWRLRAESDVVDWVLGHRLLAYVVLALS